MELMIPVDGGEVWTEVREAAGATVILLHPDWGDSTIWDGVTARLPAPTRVIRYDRRGYGRSPAPVAKFSALGDLIAIAEQLGVAGAVVVGHSGGGATALDLALARPERVRSLVLVAPGVSGYPWPEDDSYFVEFAALYAAGDREGLVRLGLRTWAAAGADPAAQAQIRSAVEAIFAQNDWAMDDPPALARLGEIRKPTEVIVGDLDHPSVIGCADVIGARIPGCHRSRAPAADHMLPLREPDLLAQLITAQSAG